MIPDATEEMHGSDRVSDLNTDCERAYGWKRQNHQLERNGALVRAHAEVWSKTA
jgi:hypothetical protein